MPYQPVGYPDRALSVELVQAMCRNGADIIEIGFPFSDPLADGPTIQAATQQGLANGVTTRDCLKVAAELRESGIRQPLLAMAYFNPVFNYGLPAFVRDAANSGYAGILVPDLPPEEAGEMEDLCHAAGLVLPCFLTPTSSKERMRLAAEKATGFVYLVSVTGTTGARDTLPAYLKSLIEEFRRYTDIPICIGFGISRGAHAAAVADIADGVIVGSALVKAAGQPDPVREVSGLARELAAGAHGRQAG